MQLTIPDEIADQAGCSGEELLFDLGIGLLMDGRLTLGQAANLAGMSRSAFLDRMSQRRIPMPYDEEDVQADVRTLRRLWPEPAP
jgi:predicted HTH domain antitoxin